MVEQTREEKREREKRKKVAITFAKAPNFGTSRSSQNRKYDFVRKRVQRNPFLSLQQRLPRLLLLLLLFAIAVVVGIETRN